MKIKIVDFLMAMGEICEENTECKRCPFFTSIGYHYGCAKDGLHKREIAKKAKDETIKYMLSKEGSKMNREQLLYSICPQCSINKCDKITCHDCDKLLNYYLDEYDKHVIEQYEAKRIRE